ncbi:sugar O-acyltransferase [Acinetobacter albensis]|uniref:PglD-related sugar-binding protein n=1 Tax=Acinetobacter albensis TaxID=1673609 RepID=UPI00187FD225|nr:sugar O-acyltransferase [Acinetobacter albensis]MBE9400365.1 sugar O-acyltransferase [Acinetobacter albensis]
MKKLAIIGTGGFAKELLDLAIDQGYHHICFLERNPKDGDTLLGFPILPESVIPTLTDTVYVIGVADPKVRKRIYEAYPDLLYPNLVHSQASLGYGIQEILEQSRGVIIAAGARITNSCLLGHFIIVSFNSTIGHDCKLDSYVSIMPGGNVSGCVQLETGVYIGTNATVLPGNLDKPRILGEYSIIGAGAVVLKNTLAFTTYIGTPAKELKSNE